MLVACSQGQNQWLAHAIGAQVHFGAEPAATASQAFVLVRRSGRASRVLVGLDCRAVDEVLVPIQLAALLGQLLQLRPNALPHASLAPAVKAVSNCGPGTVAPGQLAPRCPGAQDPEDAVENAAMVVGRSSRTWLGHQWLQAVPLPIG